MEDKKPFWTKKKLLWAALILCICVMVAALVYIVYYLAQYMGQKQVESDISSMYLNASPMPPSTSLPAEISPSDGAEPSPDEPTPSSISEYEMLIAAEEEGKIRFAELLEVNPDYRGMIFIPGILSEEGLAFVLGEDNEFYLRHDFYGKRNDNGTVFLHHNNSRLLSDRNVVMFGHNMNTGAMFAGLHKYKQAETFKTSPVVTLDSLTGKTTWIVFAAYHTEPDWGYIETQPTQAEFGDMLDEIKARSLFHSNVEVDETDRILTLSTCSYEGGMEDIRFAVHARLLRPGEEIPAEVIATENPDPLPFTPPDQIKRTDVNAAAAAVTQHPRSKKTYYYQIREGKIEWYSGGETLQGPYTSFYGKVKPGSLLTAAYHTGEAKMYFALDRYNGNQGIYLMTGKFPNSTLRIAGNGAVTPSGADAVSPMLSYSGDTMWLFYTVKTGSGEELYRAALSSNKLGTPELITSLPSGTGTRAIGQVVYDGNTMVFWHEKATQTVKGTWLGSGEFFSPQLNGGNEHLMFYGAVSGSKIKVMVENGGKLSPSTFDLSSIPPKPEADPPPETPPDTPTPSSDEVTLSPDEPSDTPPPEETPSMPPPADPSPDPTPETPSGDTSPGELNPILPPETPGT